MKKKLVLILVFLIAITNICYGYTSGGIDYLKEQDIDQWGILAVYSSNEYVKHFDLKKPKSNITTDYESYIIGALCQNKSVEAETKKIIDSQLYNGKFSDYTNESSTDLINAHIWGIISLYLANSDGYNEEKALKWLKNNQAEDGGFPVYAGDLYSDPDLTSMGLIAYSILGLENNSYEIKKGIEYIEDNLDIAQTCETVSWYIMARKFLGLPVERELFDRLIDYKLDDGTYKHIKAYDKKDYIATYTGITAYNDYYRETSIFKKLHYLNSYGDLHDNMKELESILYLIDKEIVSGYPDRTFKPGISVTRGEFAKMLIYGLDKQNQIYSTNAFEDMDKHWAKNPVNIAYKEKLINGIGNSLYAPEQNITGAQLAAILVRAKGYEHIAKLYEGDTWYYGYVKTAKQYNLLYEGFEAESNATRAQCADSVCKLIS